MTNTTTALKQAIVIGNALISVRSEYAYANTVEETTLIKTIMKISAEDSLLPTYAWASRKIAACVWSMNMSLINQLKDDIESKGVKEFRQVVNDILGNDINWGRIIVACGTALACVNVNDKSGIDYEIKRMLRQERVLAWITTHGGWDEMNSIYYTNDFSSCPKQVVSSLPSSLTLGAGGLLVAFSVCGYVLYNVFAK